MMRSFTYSLGLYTKLFLEQFQYNSLTLCFFALEGYTFLIVSMPITCPNQLALNVITLTVFSKG